MKACYKVFTDGNPKPLYQGTQDIETLIKEYVQPGHATDVRHKVARGLAVQHVNRRKGLKIHLTHPIKRVKILKDKDARWTKVHARDEDGGTEYMTYVDGDGFLKVQLEGKVSEAHIKIAATEILRTKWGWHRTVVEVLANGLSYKVKCNHKGMTYTEVLTKACIVKKSVV